MANNFRLVTQPAIHHWMKIRNSIGDIITGKTLTIYPSGSSAYSATFFDSDYDGKILVAYSGLNPISNNNIIADMYNIYRDDDIVESNIYLGQYKWVFVFSMEEEVDTICFVSASFLPDQIPNVKIESIVTHGRPVNLISSDNNGIELRALPIGPYTFPFDVTISIIASGSL